MTKPNFYSIIDRKDLVRDSKNQAILMVDSTKLQNYKEKKQLYSSIYQQQKDINELKEEVGVLKKIVAELVDK